MKKMFSESNLSMRCRKFESRFEDHLGGSADKEFEDHLSRCGDCRSALEDSRLAGELLRSAWEPAQSPSDTFRATVMARIRREESTAQSPAAFWTPLEFLASRLSLTAAMVLLALSVYLVGFAPRRMVVPGSIRTELSASDFPQPPGDPVSNEEVLQSVLERNHGR